MAVYIPGPVGIPEKGSKYICIRADGTVTNLHGEPLGVMALEVKDHGDLIDRDDMLAKHYADPLHDIVDQYGMDEAIKAQRPVIPADRKEDSNEADNPA